MSMWRSLLIVGVLALMTAPAWAGGGAERVPRPAPWRTVAHAPEISPAGLGGVVALLAGGTFLIARTRRRKS